MNSFSYASWGENNDAIALSMSNCFGIHRFSRASALPVFLQFSGLCSFAVSLLGTRYEVNMALGQFPSEMNPRKVEKNDTISCKHFPPLLSTSTRFAMWRLAVWRHYLSDSGIQACACSFVCPIRGNSVCFYSEWHGRGLKWAGIWKFSAALVLLKPTWSSFFRSGAAHQNVRSSERSNLFFGTPAG